MCLWHHQPSPRQFWVIRSGQCFPLHPLQDELPTWLQLYTPLRLVVQKLSLSSVLSAQLHVSNFKLC